MAQCRRSAGRCRCGSSRCLRVHRQRIAGDSGVGVPGRYPLVQQGRAVVLVSGLATQTPYTTTTEKCATGLSAGNSVSALRDSLVAAGQQVFTAPAQIGPGEVTSTAGIGPSSGCPAPLPAALTIDTTAVPMMAGRISRLSWAIFMSSTESLRSTLSGIRWAGSSRVRRSATRRRRLVASPCGR